MIDSLINTLLVIAGLYVYLSLFRQVAVRQNGAAALGDREFGVPEAAAAILQLIHSAGLGAVAEGIEDREQANRLRQLNCEFGQGYFFSRPLPVADMTDLLADRDGAVA